MDKLCWYGYTVITIFIAGEGAVCDSVSDN